MARRSIGRFLEFLWMIVGLIDRRLRVPPAYRPEEDRIGRILIVRLDLLGDLVMSLPAVDAVRRRWPEARIVLLCTPEAAGIAQFYPAIDMIYTYRPLEIRRLRWWLTPSSFWALLRLIRTLRAERFDLALSLFGEFACLFAWASGARHRVGYAGEAYPALFTLAVEGRRYKRAIAGREDHEVRWSGRIVEAAGAAAVGTLPRLVIPPELLRWRDDLLCEVGMSGKRYVVLSLGSHNGSAKRYRPAGWATVARHLQERHNVGIVLTGIQDDRPLARIFLEHFKGEVIDLIGRTSLQQLVALVAGAALVLTGDSAPAHLAAAAGTPVVVVFGPTSPRTYHPYTDRASVVHTTLPCSPCYDLLRTAECRLGLVEPLCMALLPTAVLLEEAEYWLTVPEAVDWKDGESVLPRERLVTPLVFR
ncbi:MAG: glycosyltransferase family 9 protein [Chloroflexi bacterium]|nr:glycosyltransferase family 9 protein [Chloroflexota bacterium]